MVRGRWGDEWSVSHASVAFWVARERRRGVEGVVWQWPIRPSAPASPPAPATPETAGGTPRPSSGGGGAP
jgi:hypothetical protein